MTDAPRPIPAAPPLAFVTCIEAGGLEQQVVRMAASLRKWGGRFAGAPVYAVQPRRGVPLAPATRAALDAAGVVLRQVRPANPYPWNAYLNKPLALMDGEALTDAEAVCWLDADVLVLGEPTLLVLAPDEDFTACAADKNIGTAADDDVFAAYWREVCRALGTTLDALPWVVTQTERARIRLYFNSGVFAYRRGAGFAARYMADCVKLLDARIASRASGTFFTDQVALGLTMLGMGLRWRPLPHAYNYAVGSKLERDLDRAAFAGATLVHYHDAMWPAYWPRLLELLKADRPEVHDWLAPQGPLTGRMPVVKKVASKLLGMARGRRRDRHRAGCQVY